MIRFSCLKKRDRSASRAIISFLRLQIIFARTAVPNKSPCFNPANEQSQTLSLSTFNHSTRGFVEPVPRKIYRFLARFSRDETRYQQNTIAITGGTAASRFALISPRGSPIIIIIVIKNSIAQGSADSTAPRLLPKSATVLFFHD